MQGTDSEDEYEVEKIIDSRIQRGDKFFRIRWKGFPPDEDTWEPVENLNHCLGLVKEFEKSRERSTSRSRTPIISAQKNEIVRKEQPVLEEVMEDLSQDSDSQPPKSQNMIFSPHGFKETYGRYPLIDEVKENVRMRSIAKLKGETTPELKVESSTVKHKTPQTRKQTWFLTLYIAVAIITIAALLYLMDILQLFSFPST